MGFPVDRFKDPPSSYLQCAVCKAVPDDPVLCENEHVFCRLCMDKSLADHQTCPADGSPLTIQGVSESWLIRNTIKGL